MRWSVGWFGVKDLFTMVNLLGGVMGIYFAALGNPLWAGYAILAGYFFGDALDGVVARATNTGNRFGAEFDSAADHIGQGIAPAVVVWSAYRIDGHNNLGLLLMAALITTASIRQARFNVADFNAPLTYLGLPRTISGFIALAYPNSAIFHATRFGYQGGVVVIGLMAVLNLVPIPYMTHRGKRKMQLWVKALVVSFLISPFVVFFVARSLTFDVIFIYGFGYALGGWIPILPDERKAFYDNYHRWAAEVSSLK
ncbi:MAG TPA: CDP-alcohol phosphatidyltransferase family protein [Polyangia bacterium]|jgi:CDP-diacylglycerol--serine O-phosphatidyltransferase|nr:CDP-alcohol phosphatidyltransferase family protein [Polyangia bacterium]